MKKNIGKVDKSLRLVLGIIILAFGLIFQSWWGAIGLVLVVTAFINFCPLYCPLNISTAENKEKC